MYAFLKHVLNFLSRNVYTVFEVYDQAKATMPSDEVNNAALIQHAGDPVLLRNDNFSYCRDPSRQFFLLTTTTSNKNFEN